MTTCSTSSRNSASCTQAASSPTTSSPPRRRRSSAAEPRPPADPYVSLAADYRWFAARGTTAIGCDTPGVRLALRGVPPGAKLLDAACGIGDDVIHLAQRGIDVTGGDASPAMTEIARERIRHAGLDCEISTTRWTDLPAAVGIDRFDVVLCVGSSIAHANGPDELLATFEAFRRVLVDGGLLVVDTRDWESTEATDDGRLEVEPRAVVEGDATTIRTYRWSRSTSGRSVRLAATLIRVERDAVTTRTHEIEQFPFTRHDLRVALRAAGFGQVALDAVPGDDRYTATARR